MKARRFLNVVTQNCLLSRIKLKNNLFYPSAAEARQQAAMAAASNKKNENTAAAAAEEEDVLRLPSPKVRIKPSSQRRSLIFRRLKYMPFYGGGGEVNNILCVDEAGHTALYDADASTVEMMPKLVGPKGPRPISFSVTRGGAGDPHDPARPHALYVLEGVFSSHSPCRFEALVYGDPNPQSHSPNYTEGYVWHWRPLPPPPVRLDSAVDCHALLHGHGHAGGGTVYVSYSISFDSVGTYRFDTGTNEWTKAGDWSLPFCFEPLHVPDLGLGDDLLFGIESDQPYRFCAMDAAGLRVNKAPVLQHAWLEVDPLPEWTMRQASVAYLGDRRFCIHRSFDIIGRCGIEWGSVGTVVFLTGVEVVRDGPRLRMIKHKSRRVNSGIDHVL